MNHIGFLFILFLSSFLPQSLSSEHIKFVQHQDESKLSKLKQLFAFIQDPEINSLLKLNLQILENQKANLLQNWYSKQQLETIIQIKKSLNSWKQCPKINPYFDGNTCISCKKTGEVFDILAKACVVCRSGWIYDQKQKECINRKTILNIELTEMDPLNAQEIIIIRANRIAGELMSFIHEKTSKLKLTVNESNLGQNLAYPTPNLTNPHFLNLVVLNHGKNIQDLQQKEGDVPCPKQTPFYSKDKCISCEYPNHLFDPITQLCVKCSGGYIFSVKDHVCVKVPESNSTSHQLLKHQIKS